MKTIYVNGVAVGEVSATGDVQQDMQAVRDFLKARNLLPERDVVRQIRAQAIAFANAAQLVWDKYLRTTPSTNGFSAVAFVVNGAFSVELYLKALHQIAGTPQRGHHLLILYDALPDEIKDSIGRAAIRYGPEFLPRSEFPGGFDFREFVRDLDNSFVEWRYAYEESGTGMVKLHPTILVMKVLHEVCVEYHADVSRPGSVK